MIAYQVRGIVHQFKSWRRVLLLSSEDGRLSPHTARQYDVSSDATVYILTSGDILSFTHFFSATHLNLRICVNITDLL